jgi:hypothetical protein
MILGFYRNINGRPTYFKEKILSCKEPVTIINPVFLHMDLHPRNVANVKVSNHQVAMFIEVDKGSPSGILEVPLQITLKPKRLTIREDKSNRWKIGRKIQMVYRGPKYSIADHFNKGISELEECKTVQRITIKWRRPTWLQKDYGDAIPPFTLKVKNQFLYITIDGQLIGHKTLKQLAINDGFESIGDFLRYWKKSINDWKIISWCNESTY